MAWMHRNITAAGTVVVFRAPTDLMAVVVCTAAAGASVLVVDGNDPAATDPNQVATIDASATGNFFFGSLCRGGVLVTMSGGNANVTIIHNPYPQGFDFSDVYGAPVEANR